MKKRFLSALLALTMSMTAFAAVPVTASAAALDFSSKISSPFEDFQKLPENETKDVSVTKNTQPDDITINDNNITTKLKKFISENDLPAEVVLWSEYADHKPDFPSDEIKHITVQYLQSATTTTTTAEPIKGDANCDSSVNMADAVLIMQSIANPAKYGVKGSDNSHITEQGMKNADITGNNDGVTNADALAVQKKLLNINDDADTTVIYLPITPVEGYTGTYPVTSHVVTTTTTTAPLSEQERKLAELEKKERSQGRMPRERQIILGNIPADAPRLSYEEAKQIADNSASRNELAAEIRKRYPYPDNLGMETDDEYYWLDDEGKELILLSEYFWTNVYYCNSEKNIFKPIMSIAEQKMMKEIKAEEEKLGVYLVRERQKAAGQIHPKRQHLSLEKIKGFAADSKDFAEFWKKLDFADYPDTWDGNDKPVLTYELEADNGCVIVSLSGAYAEYVNGDKSESIIKDKGTLTAETIEKKLVTLRDIVEMTE
jgi:hypothetical protein